MGEVYGCLRFRTRSMSSTACHECGPYGWSIHAPNRVWPHVPEHGWKHQWTEASPPRQNSALEVEPQHHKPPWRVETTLRRPYFFGRMVQLLHTVRQSYGRPIPWLTRPFRDEHHRWCPCVPHFLQSGLSRSIGWQSSLTCDLSHFLSNSCQDCLRWKKGFSPSARKGKASSEAAIPSTTELHRCRRIRKSPRGDPSRQSIGEPIGHIRQLLGSDVGAR